MTLEQKFRRNIHLLYTHAFLGGLEFYIPIYALYLQEELSSLFYVTLMLALRSLAVLVLEIPTGALADLFGRKRTLIVGQMFRIAAVSFFFIGESLIIIAIGVLCSAMTQSLNSGTTTSILFESIERIEGADKPSFKRSNGILSSLWPIGASISSVAGGLLSTITLRLPFLVAIIPFSIALLTLFFLEETTDRSDSDETTESSNSLITQTRESIGIILSNRQLLIIFSVGLLSYALGEVMHQLKPIFFEFKDIDLVFFGVLFAFAFSFSFVGFLASDPISTKFGNKRTLIVTFFIPIPMQILAVLTTGFMSGFLVTIGSLSWGIRWPILSEMTNREISNSHRSTVLSTSAFFNNLGFVISSPLIGLALGFTNINMIYLFEAVVSLIILVPYFYLKDTKSE